MMKIGHTDQDSFFTRLKTYLFIGDLIRYNARKHDELL
jgi:hypothetical protein